MRGLSFACLRLVVLVFMSVIGVTSTANAQNTFVPQGQVNATGNPQVASYTISVPSESTVSIKFGKDTNYGLRTSAQKAPAGGGTLTILVAGMQAKTTYHMQAEVVLTNGTTVSDSDRTFTTGDVPANVVPPFTVATTQGMTPQPGIELVNDVFGGKPSAVFATDLSGNVIWTYSLPDRQPGSTIYPIKLLPNGDFVMVIGPQSQSVLQTPVSDNTLNVIREIDLSGKTIKELRMKDLNDRLVAAGYNNLKLQAFHHDITPLPNGHWLVLASIIRQYSNLFDAPPNTNVLGDVVVDVDTNFQPVWVWNEFDHLDVNRRPFGFPDWTHSNAITYSSDDGDFLISVRHQNWIVKVDYRDGKGSGNVIWRFGPGGDFKLLGGTDPTDWIYAQHNPSFFSQNTNGVFRLGIMDNGNDRRFPNGSQCGASGAQACYTTVPVFEIDDHGMTTTLKFHRVLAPNMYSSFAGSVGLLSNGNIEFNLAAVGSDAYTYELTQDSNPQVVWQMHISGTNTYRVFRMPSLYPGVQW